MAFLLSAAGLADERRLAFVAVRGLEIEPDGGLDGFRDAMKNHTK